MKMLSGVLAHTGNDAIDHSFKLADGIIGVLIIFIIIGISIYLIKKDKEKK